MTVFLKNLLRKGNQKMRSETEYSAASLFDGGWRSKDREELIGFYDLEAEEADEICEELKRIEETQK